jgi:membrane associated rhomboid family serine protease
MLDDQKRREPIFNIPGSLAALIALLAVIHLVRVYLLTDEQDVEVLLRFAFIPARYDVSILGGTSLPGGAGAEIWTFVTYALLHADATHIGFNVLWLLPFGSAVARRFGSLRFILFLIVSAAGGALAHLITHPGAMVPMIGASAAVSGAMAAAMRFVFQHGGPISFWRHPNEAAYHIPAIPLSGVLRDPRVLAFLLVWFGSNILFGLGTVPITGTDQAVAWQAHIGGFLIGMFLFSLFDPPARAPEPPDFDREQDGSMTLR